jgi:hypothetical protein
MTCLEILAGRSKFDDGFGIIHALNDKMTPCARPE